MLRSQKNKEHRVNKITIIIMIISFFLIYLIHIFNFNIIPEIIICLTGILFIAISVASDMYTMININSYSVKIIIIIYYLLSILFFNYYYFKYLTYITIIYHIILMFDYSYYSYYYWNKIYKYQNRSNKYDNIIIKNILMYLKFMQIILCIYFQSGYYINKDECPFPRLGLIDYQPMD